MKWKWGGGWGRINRKRMGKKEKKEDVGNDYRKASAYQQATLCGASALQ